MIHFLLDGKYELLELLGRGGMGSVYRARHLLMEDDVAVKILKVEDFANDDARRRFRREAAATRRLKHENIVIIHDFAEPSSNDVPAYIVMELLRGTPLSKILVDETRLETTRAISLMSDICKGVSFAHKNGVIHRDLKPANILVLPVGDNNETVKIVDFGIAKIFDANKLWDVTVTEGLTQGPTVMGTFPYMSPEACRGEKLDERSDIYSLGATMYHMIAGKPAFMARSPSELQWKHEHEEPPSLRTDGSVPAKLEKVILRAMERKPENRPKDASIFAQELQSVLESDPTIIDTAPLLSDFEFEVATVAANGCVTGRKKGKARSFKEEIDGESIELVEIPGGEFNMGSPHSEVDRKNDEGPQRRVKVPRFFISRYEITQAQWRAIASMEIKVSLDLNQHPSYFKGDKKPVESVSWHDALEFCLRLSRVTGRQYRLPSEAQWEYACRGGSATPFCWGENICDEAVNYDARFPYGGAQKGDCRSTTINVGSLGVANNFGLCDMLGNVWEWCQDVYHHSYEGAPVDGSAWLGRDSLPRVVRGGSWRAPAVHCGSAARNSNPPNTLDNDIGFRVVCTGLPIQKESEPITVPISIDEPVTHPSKLKPLLAKLRARLSFPQRKSPPTGLVQALPNAVPLFFSFFLIHILVAAASMDVFVPSMFGNLLGPLLWGLMLGVLQSLVLRRYLPTITWWIVATVAGALVAGLIHSYSGLSWTLKFGDLWWDVKKVPMRIVTLISLRWFLIGMAQWLVLRQLSRAGLIWPVATLASAVIFGLGVTTFFADIPTGYFYVTLVFVAALLLAAAQTATLLYFKRKPLAPAP
jgi:formylglycine-generating enzyme required for sulfatase activity